MKSMDKLVETNKRSSRVVYSIVIAGFVLVALLAALSVLYITTCGCAPIPPEQEQTVNSQGL